MEELTSLAASETSGNDGGLNGFEEHESLFMLLSQEFPEGGSSEWTDKKHRMYLRSMEDSFINQLHNSLDTRNWKDQNECSTDSMSSRRSIHANNHCPSSQVLHDGLLSRIGSRGKNLVPNDVKISNVSSTNTWIQLFKNGNKQGATEEKPSLTSCSNTEVTDQNFVEEDSGVQMTNTACSKKRKTTYAVPKSVIKQ